MSAAETVSMNHDEKKPSNLGAIQKPSFVFFGVVAAITMSADIATKIWAELTINARGLVPVQLIEKHLAITLAYNKGGAWGFGQNTAEAIRLPFFLAVSVGAIFFLISLYSKLHPSQKALKWGLPLVLGGALGNLSDRITRSQVVDFIDYQANWVLQLNTVVKKFVSSWSLTDHWPTFNVADVAICVGVGLMAVDMFTHRNSQQKTPERNSKKAEAVLDSEVTQDNSLTP